LQKIVEKCENSKNVDITDAISYAYHNLKHSHCGVIYLFHIAIFLLFCLRWQWKVTQKRKWLQVIHLYIANGIDIPLTRDLHPLVSWTHLWVPMDQNNCEVKILWGTKFTFHFAIWRVSYICIYIYTSIASWKKSTVISVPNNSSASLVNLLIIVHALKIASVININDVQTQTLQYTFNNYIYIHE
jgi:hypothetical protein